jgi:hypothetical protein
VKLSPAALAAPVAAVAELAGLLQWIRRVLRAVDRALDSRTNPRLRAALPRQEGARVRRRRARCGRRPAAVRGRAREAARGKVPAA